MTPTNIAIADDHVLVRQGLVSMIEREGNFTVVYQAGNGRLFLEYLRSTRTLPGICLLDICMPEMDGYETLKEIKAQWPSIKVLMLSMFLTNFNVLRVMSAGANGVFSKGSDGETLLRALYELRNEGFYSSEYVSPEIIRAAKRKSVVPINICKKELEFLKLCVSELTYDQIAQTMGIGKRTVDSYRESLFLKLKVCSRAGLIIFAIQSGLVVL